MDKRERPRIKPGGLVCACNPRNGKLRQDLEFKDNLDYTVRLRLAEGLGERRREQ